MKNGSCPSGVTSAPLSHSTWMRPAKVSATTGPADTLSTTGCSPIGSPGIPQRFVPIPYDNNDLLNRCIPFTQGFRFKFRKGSNGGDQVPFALDRNRAPYHKG